MKHLWPLAVMAIALVAADKPAADKPAEKKTDMDLIQGTWVLVASESGGEESKPPPGVMITKTFKGDSLIHSSPNEDKGMFTLDASKKPPPMTVVVTKDKKETTRVHLYDLQGDTLRLCMSPPFAKNPVPAEFNSKDDRIILTLKRQEKKPEK